MGMSAGRLDQRIQVRRFVGTGLNAYGNTDGAWTDHGAPIFAQRRDVSDAERISSGIWQNKLVTRFTIRATAFGRDLRRADRIVHAGIEFEISGIKQVPGSRAFIEITAETEQAP